MKKRTLIHISSNHNYPKRLFIAVVMTLCVCVCMAQNNPYKINNELYKLYLEAYNLHDKPEGIEKAQYMYDRAVQMGDKKAQCIALTIPIIYYTMAKDEAKYEQVFKKLKEKTHAYNYEQYYYFGVINKVNLLINLHRTPEAFEYVRSIEKEVDRSNSMYGRYTVLNALGTIHMINNNQCLAADCYEQALKIGQEYLKGHDMAVQYRKIAECYENLYDYKRMLAYAEKGYNMAKSQMSKLSAIRGVCYAAFMLGKYDVFLKYYDQYTTLSKHKPSHTSQYIHECELAIFKLIHENKFDDADEAINMLPKAYKAHKLRLQLELCRFKGDYAECGRILDRLVEYRLNSRNDSLNYAEIYSHINNELLEKKNRQLAIKHQQLLNERQQVDLHNSKLELDNAQLSLNNSDLELQRTRSAAKLMSYKFANKKLEAQQLRSKIDAEHTRKYTNRVKIAFFSLVVLVILVMSTLYILLNRRIMKRLRKINAELEIKHRQLREAKEHAEDANRAKTAFINSIDERIQKPLNGVVYYAQTIAESTSQTTNAEHKANAKEMERHNKALLNIVGEALNKIQR